MNLFSSLADEFGRSFCKDLCSSVIIFFWYEEDWDVNYLVVVVKVCVDIRMC